MTVSILKPIALLFELLYNCRWWPCQNVGDAGPDYKFWRGNRLISHVGRPQTSLCCLTQILRVLNYVLVKPQHT